MRRPPFREEPILGEGECDGIVCRRLGYRRARHDQIDRAPLHRPLCHARERVDLLQLAVVSENETAQRFYRNFGFAEYGHEVHALKQSGRYYDEVLMAVALQSNFKFMGAIRKESQRCLMHPRRDAIGCRPLVGYLWARRHHCRAVDRQDNAVEVVQEFDPALGDAASWLA
jgi:hypothetical protein